MLIQFRYKIKKYMTSRTGQKLFWHLSYRRKWDKHYIVLPSKQVLYWHVGSLGKQTRSGEESEFREWKKIIYTFSEQVKSLVTWQRMKLIKWVRCFPSPWSFILSIKSHERSALLHIAVVWVGKGGWGFHPLPHIYLIRI